MLAMCLRLNDTLIARDLCRDAYVVIVAPGFAFWHQTSSDARRPWEGLNRFA